MAGYLKRRKAASAIYLMLACLVAAGPLLIRLRRPAEIKIIGYREAQVDGSPTKADAQPDIPPELAEQSMPVPNVSTTKDPSLDSKSKGETAEESLLFVHVAGQVAKPGLYGLPQGSRVHHAVEAAGGFSPGADRDSVNIALPVADGQQVFIPKKPVQTSAATAQKAKPAASMDLSGGSSAATGAEEPEGRLDVTASVPAGGEEKKDAEPGLIDINSASAAQLEELPGIGPATALKIIQHRKDNGPFASIEGLMDVSGIGPAKFAAIKDMVTAK
ncbi:MAG TPA: helix-hairpin-helix domain-containing protein [Bacillota bacterium]|nr:helix-hairpin-helix domain-containing protein [Bacillota bacterium]